MNETSASINLKTDRMSPIAKSFLLAGFALVAVAIQGVRADTIIFNNVPSSGSQNNYALGMDFIVNSPVTVTQLGAFDSTNNGAGFNGPITVGIFSVSNASPGGSGTLVGTSVILNGTAGTPVGGSRFVSVTPFTLTPGLYSIVAAGFGLGTDFNGNSQTPGENDIFNADGGNLTLVSKGGRWNDNSAFAFPNQHTFANSPYGQSDPVFQAGTFAVPDGGMTVALLGIGLCGLGLIRRRLA